jgi:YfiH family protein
MIPTIKNGIPLLQFSNLSAFKDLFQFTTIREGGISSDNYRSFNLGFNSGDKAERVAQNRSVLCSALEINQKQIIFPKQTHSSTIKTIYADFLDSDEYEKKIFLSETDAIVTELKGICIGIKTADCVPILLFDQKKKVIAAIHAGWRGTVQKITHLTVKRMISEFNTDPIDIFAGIGPSISPEVYEVGAEVWSQFNSQYYQPNGSGSSGKRLLDLWKANCDQLVGADVPVNQIEVAGLCTFSNSSIFFSARRDGLKTGRMATGIMLLK